VITNLMTSCLMYSVASASFTRQTGSYFFFLLHPFLFTYSNKPLADNAPLRLRVISVV